MFPFCIIVNLCIFALLTLDCHVNGQVSTSENAPSSEIEGDENLTFPTSTPSPGIPSTSTSFRSIFTVPSAADTGATLIPNLEDQNASDAQSICPGYNASNVARNELGLTATLTLAGAACNVYGNDVDLLNLTVEFQSNDRLAIQVKPAFVGKSNSTFYNLPDYIVTRPTVDADANSTSLTSDLNFVWSNDPTFPFTIYRNSTGDALFSTSGTKLIFEDQFGEFASRLPENYNLYGLGETIHGLRLGNNFTKTIYAADTPDTIDA